MRFLASALPAAALAAAAMVAPPPAPAQSAVLEAPDLRGYVAEVLRGNPGLDAARSRVGAAERRIAPAGALPDPMITAGAMSVPVASFDLEREAMTQIPAVMVEQRLPFPGKRAAATAVARADSAVAEGDRSVAESRLAAAAVSAYYALAEARTSLEVWRSQAALADQAIAVTQVRYETGGAQQTDVLRAHLRRAELEEERHRLEADVTVVEARLDALRAGPGEPVTPPLLVSTAAVPGLRGDVVPASSDLRERLAGSPTLRTAGSVRERAERTARVFAIAGRPDFTVGLQGGARFAGREPFVTALVGISVPLYAGRKQGPAADAARLDAEAAQGHYDDVREALEAEVESARASLAALRERVLWTADEILPLAEAASASALQRYRVGALDFSAVLDAQDGLFGAQLRLAHLIADYGVAWGDLAALLGEEWYR